MVIHLEEKRALRAFGYWLDCFVAPLLAMTNLTYSPVGELACSCRPAFILRDLDSDRGIAEEDSLNFFDTACTEEARRSQSKAPSAGSIQF